MAFLDLDLEQSIFKGNTWAGPDRGQCGRQKLNATRRTDKVQHYSRWVYQVGVIYRNQIVCEMFNFVEIKHLVSEMLLELGVNLIRGLLQFS